MTSHPQLDQGETSRSFTGESIGAGVSIILVDVAPGKGPRLHRHKYEEVFVVQAGTATFTRGDESLEVRPGDVVVVSPPTPHRFVATGSERLRLVAIHHAPDFETEWLE
jgi:mannose-6-phosphate isomerase-like protein (cupin superfamily)